MKFNKVIGFTVLGLLCSFAVLDENPLKLFYPEYWPDPIANLSSDNLSNEEIELGRHLFYDPILSADSTISCASCHLSFTAFTHVDHALSHGIYDSIGTRNSPVLINLAWNKTFMWDGAVNHIEVQALAPITHPSEMGEDISNVISKLNRSSKYPDLFNKAYGSKIVTGEHLLKAIAAFQLTLISSNSRYDKMQRGELDFSEQEQKGYQLFQSNCTKCHVEPLLTNGDFHNNGLELDNTLNDYGRYLITKSVKDSLKFKVPTLRNVQYSKPYMHDGRYATLMDVITFYSEGSRNGKSELKPMNFTSEQKVDLVAFLLTLTDQEFLFNPKFGFPKDRN